MMAQSDPELAAAILLLFAPSLVVLVVLYGLAAFAEWLRDRRQNVFNSHPIHGGNMRRRDR